MRAKVIKIVSLALAVASCVGIVFTVLEITAKHQIVSIRKVITKENGEEVTIFDDPGFDDFLDDAIGDLDFDDDFDDIDLEDVSEDEDIIEDDLEIPDALTENLYNSKNPKKGSTVGNADAERDITISLSDVAYSGFMVSGGNSFSELTSDGAVTRGFDCVDWELTKYFYNKLHGGYSRMLFNMDCMMTNNGDPEKDCKDWTDGVYVFDNEQMSSFWRMVEAQKEAGATVWLNSGWKVATRIQSWYGASTNYPKDSAPYYIKAFVRANIRLLQECERRYPGAVKYIGFGNEASKGDDFAVDGDVNRYQIALYSLMKKMLNYCQTNEEYTGDLAYMSLKGIKLTSGEDMRVVIESWDQSYIQTASQLFSSDVIDGYSVHMYYNQDRNIMTTYSTLFERLCYVRNMIPGSSYNNETAMISYCERERWQAIDPDTYDEWWNFTFASNLIATANAGVQGLNKWTYGAGYWPASNTLVEGNSVSSEGTKVSVGSFLFETQNELSCSTQYYTAALLQNYITKESDVLTVNWEGEDIRVAAFKLDDGNYTILVEAKESTLPTRELNFKLDKTLGKKLYRYAYSETTDTVQDTLIPVSDSTWTKNNIGTTFSDTIDGDYSVYLYTTKEPVKQLSTTKVVSVKKGDNVSIDLEYIDCEGDVVWEIAASAPANNATKTFAAPYVANDQEFWAEKGELAVDGTTARYTASSSANVGDRIVIKVYLKDDPSVYSVTLVQIVN